ncbi:hypothetical protein BDV96DRAFT_628472 [Lophiotrema nucula]|uniref:Uncharacterized protein n=1 Tax=Lophiotrema nucula TaxID=690887 RepID=A0A6A5ZLH3_9PLEO|nr:hypothetical protein BDV96DRAFT_628472 [Lophiotrema nucula]
MSFNPLSLLGRMYNYLRPSPSSAASSPDGATTPSTSSSSATSGHGTAFSGGPQMFVHNTHANKHHRANYLSSAHNSANSTPSDHPHVFKHNIDTSGHDATPIARSTSSSPGGSHTSVHNTHLADHGGDSSCSASSSSPGSVEAFVHNATSSPINLLPINRSSADNVSPISSGITGTQNKPDVNSPTSSVPLRDTMFGIPTFGEHTRLASSLPNLNMAGGSSSKQPQKEHLALPTAAPSALDASTTAGETANESGRKKLDPTSPASLKRTGKTKEEIEAKIFMEEDDGTLPDGYIGTYEDVRYYHLPQPPHDCGSNNLHELVCKHYVSAPSSSSCGLNCKTPNINVEAFKCRECHDLVMSILHNELSDTQKQKIETAAAAGRHLFVIGFCVEFVTNWVAKRGKEMHGVAETVMGVLQFDYGRNCDKATAPEVKFSSIVEQIQLRDEYRVRKKFERQHAGASGTKREETATAPIATDEQPAKQQRTRLELGTEPLPEPNPTTKRKEAAADEAPLKPAKQQRTKLGTVPEPVSARTRGKKRDAPEEPPIALKRVSRSKPSVQFGHVSTPGAPPPLSTAPVSARTRQKRGPIVEEPLPSPMGPRFGKVGLEAPRGKIGALPVQRKRGVGEDTEAEQLKRSRLDSYRLPREDARRADEGWEGAVGEETPWNDDEL